LVAKVIAIRDWKLAYQERGEPVGDQAALLSSATVYQFMADFCRPFTTAKIRYFDEAQTDAVHRRIAGQTDEAAGQIPQPIVP
jgi:glycerol dehydrogenase-like iron-containing ADH family enzyme